MSSRNLEDQRVKEIYMDHCVQLMSMQKLFRHNPDAMKVEIWVLDACVELERLLKPHMTPEESQKLSDRLIYA